MTEMVSLFSIISINDEVEELAQKYIHHGAVPTEYMEDAYHIAIATINEMDCLLSWNFKQGLLQIEWVKVNPKISNRP
jgi:hypothetical protein